MVRHARASRTNARAREEMHKDECLRTYMALTRGCDAETEDQTDED